MGLVALSKLLLALIKIEGYLLYLGVFSKKQIQQLEIGPSTPSLSLSLLCIFKVCN